MPKSKTTKQDEPSDVRDDETEGEDKKPRTKMPEPNPDIESNQEHPDPKTDFATIMMNYGISEQRAKAIIKNMVDTGSANVFFNVDELIHKMAAFPMWVPPALRQQVLDHWIAINKLPVPENYTEIAGASSATIVKASNKEKYTVDSDGNIAVASSTENALTYDEAEKLAARKKAEKKSGENRSIPRYVYDTVERSIRMAKEGELGGTMEEAKELKAMADRDAELKAKVEQEYKKEPESPFTISEDGKWTLVPGARLKTEEMMMWQAIQKAEATGQPIDPMQYMLDISDKFKNFRDLMGGGGGIPDWMKDPVQFRKMMAPENSGDSEAMKELKTELQTMRAEQHAAELRQRDQTIANLTSQAERDKNELLQKIEDVKKDQRVTGKTIYDLVDKMGNKFPEAREVIEGIRTLGQNPPKFPLGGPADVSKRLENAAGKLEESGALKKAGDNWFNLR
jgi:hypothetical protein